MYYYLKQKTFRLVKLLVINSTLCRNGLIYFIISQQLWFCNALSCPSFSLLFCCWKFNLDLASNCLCEPKKKEEQRRITTEKRRKHCQKSHKFIYIFNDLSQRIGCLYLLLLLFPACCSLCCCACKHWNWFDTKEQKIKQQQLGKNICRVLRATFVGGNLFSWGFRVTRGSYKIYWLYLCDCHCVSVCVCVCESAREARWKHASVLI